MPEGEVKLTSAIEETPVAEPERRSTSVVWGPNGMQPGPAAIAMGEVVQLRLGEEYPDLPPAA